MNPLPKCSGFFFYELGLDVNTAEQDIQHKMYDIEMVVKCIGVL